VIKVQPNVVIISDGNTRRYKNNMVQGGFDWLVNFIVSNSGAVLTHIAIGDNANPVSQGDVVLHNELTRKTISLLENDNGTAYAEVFVDMNEANFHWREIGLFAGGTAEKDSGTLIARCLVDEAKDSRRTATISWEIGFANV